MIYTDLNTGIDVGASAHKLEIGGFNALIDCGVHPKKTGLDSLPDIKKLGDDTLDFIAVTHAHLDHVGALPIVAEHQAMAQILMGEVTEDLSLRMLRNSRNVMARQREELGISEYPLFGFSQIDALKGRIFSFALNHPRTFEYEGRKLEVEFYRAGHIPGATAISLRTPKESVLFTGDISFRPSQIIKGSSIPDCRCDVLVMETTRGETERGEGATYEAECARFVTALGRVIRDGGSVLVPAFALGRMQEVLQLIKRGKQSGEIPADTHVYCAGLGIDISEYLLRESRKNPGLSFDKTAYDLIEPFRDKIVPAQDFPKKGIYVLGSGMLLENTPSYAAAAALMDHPQNAIFFVGYCDPDTPGGRLLKKAKGDTTFAFHNLGYIARVNCKIDKFDLSSHADRRELLDFALRCDPRTIILTHGSEEARGWFMDEILDIAPQIGVIIPEPGVPEEV